MKNLITIGVGALALVGGLLLYNQSKKRVHIPREEVVRLIKLLREEMYMPLVEISAWASQNASHATPDMLRQLLKSKESPFKDILKEKEEIVFQNVSKEDFEECLQDEYKDDVEVQYLVRKFQEEF